MNQNYNDFYFFCIVTVGAGTIVNEQGIILTAASIVLNPYETNITQKLRVRLPGLTRLYKVKRLMVNRVYERSGFRASNDLALIQLKKKLNFKRMPTVEPACFDEEIMEKPYPNLTFAGYGSTSVVVGNETSGQISNYTQSTKLREGFAEDVTYTNEWCKNHEYDYICAINEKRNDTFCFGDQGGPWCYQKGKYTFVIGISGLPIPKYREDGLVLLCDNVNRATRMSTYTRWLAFMLKNYKLDQTFCTGPN